MKRFTLLFSIFGLLAFWAAYQAWLAPKPSPKTESTNVSVPVYDATGEMLKHTGDQLAVSVTGANAQIVPVYDATGEMLKHTGNQAAVPATGSDAQIVPIYDATGEMLKHLGK